MEYTIGPEWPVDLDAIHIALDFIWLLTAIALIYFGLDVHHRLGLANRATAVSKSMIAVGAGFLLLAAFHIHEDLLGGQLSPALHLVPLLVLAYGGYEYHRLIREAQHPI